MQQCVPLTSSLNGGKYAQSKGSWQIVSSSALLNDMAAHSCYDAGQKVLSACEK